MKLAWLTGVRVSIVLCTLVGWPGSVTSGFESDGKELFYISADSKMMSADVFTGAAFKSAVPKALFPAPVIGGASTTNTARYDVTPDGKKFLINTVGDAASSLPIAVVLNWQAALKK